MTVKTESARFFSKRILIYNMIGAWVLIGFATWHGDADTVLTQCFGFMITILGLYIGVGHLDYRQVLETKREIAIKTSERNQSAQMTEVIEVKT